MSKIANYDTFDYDYRTYWKNREYEDKAEHLILKKIYSKEKGNWFVDIGGSYGRLTDSYYKSYKNPVIIDYSLKTLQNNASTLLEAYPNLTLIAANAYYLPFKDNSFDGGLMVRVLHHIDEPEKYFKEAYRILNAESTYTQEFANKVHIKALLKSLLTLNLSQLSKEPFQQPDKNNNEGARKGSHVPFLNYHPEYIREKLEEIGFQVENKYGCSYLRSTTLKKIFGVKIMISAEKLFQSTLSWSNISPSIFLKARTKKEKTHITSSEIEDILACPYCHGKLDIKKDKATCEQCEKSFKKDNNIWDFRI